MHAKKRKARVSTALESKTKNLLSPDRAIFAGRTSREEATRLARKQKKAKLPNGKTLTGFTKQFTCSAPEPISPTGTKAPKLVQPFVAYAIKGCPDRFMVSMRVKLGIE
ncbi:MAG: hypothetical protein DME26_03080 [Verrucomicrobia bacterium]|nr:MAG: hypothetical protein DME26_03080 [Verrucomicrobiota bacterium]